jgi:hypothetical protein
VIAEDDTAAPTVGLRIGDRGVEYRAVARFLVELRAGYELQCRVDGEPVGSGEPARVVLEGGAFSRALGVVTDQAE